MYPTISSPGSGLQHFESFTKQLSIPFTIIPEVDGFGFLVLDNACIFYSISSS